MTDKKVRVQFSIFPAEAQLLKALQDDPLYTESQWFTHTIRRLYEEKFGANNTTTPQHHNNQTTQRASYSSPTTQPTTTTKQPRNSTSHNDDDESWRLMPGYEHPSETRDKRHAPKIDAAEILANWGELDEE